MTHHADGPVTDPAMFWEDRYRGRGQTWSGRPNAALVREVAGLEPGRALDLGCGEGGDAIWLAQGGWSVIAVDIAPSALSLGARNAEAAGVASGIRWTQADLAAWLPEGSFDLISAQFLASPVELPWEEVLRRAASAVAAGGLLVVVGHAEMPPWSSHAHHHLVLPTPDDVLAALALPPGDWTVATLAVVDREATGPDGTSATLADGVLTVRRLGQ
jgi:SAM-dependent methyltransferase